MSRTTCEKAQESTDFVCIVCSCQNMNHQREWNKQHMLVTTHLVFYWVWKLELLFFLALFPVSFIVSHHFILSTIHSSICWFTTFKWWTLKSSTKDYSRKWFTNQLKTATACLEQNMICNQANWCWCNMSDIKHKYWKFVQNTFINANYSKLNTWTY